MRQNAEKADMAGGDIVLYTAARRVFIGDTEICLTPMEYSLLEVLALHNGLCLSRGQLLDLAWGYAFEGGTRTVDIHISRLRRKLRLKTEISTVFKYGYCLNSRRIHLQAQGGPPPRKRRAAL